MSHLTHRSARLSRNNAHRSSRSSLWSLEATAHGPSSRTPISKSLSTVSACRAATPNTRPRREQVQKRRAGMRRRQSSLCAAIDLASRRCPSPRSRLQVEARPRARYGCALPILRPLKADTTVGPLTTERGLDRAAELVKDAVEHGATVLAGGNRVGPGFHFEPTILIDAPLSAAVHQTEMFGPIASLYAFDTEEEVRADKIPLTPGDNTCE